MTDIEYLKSKKWREVGSTAWRWADPEFTGTYYTLKDAVEIQNNRDRSKK